MIRLSDDIFTKLIVPNHSLLSIPCFHFGCVTMHLVGLYSSDRGGIGAFHLYKTSCVILNL